MPGTVRSLRTSVSDHACSAVDVGGQQDELEVGRRPAADPDIRHRPETGLDARDRAERLAQPSHHLGAETPARSARGFRLTIQPARS